MSAETDSLNARLKAFALMLRFGHELFAAKTFADAAAMAVNNSRTLLNFKSSSLFELTGGKATLAAQYAQVALNPHSRLATLQKDLCESLKDGDGVWTLDRTNGLPEELAGENSIYLVLRLKEPENTPEQRTRFLWILEYEKEVPSYALNTAKLLASSIAEGLYYQRFSRSAAWSIRKQFGFKRIAWVLLFLLLAGIMFLRVPESANAEFTLKAPVITSAYAWFDGPIAKCVRQDGELVKTGDLIAEYDVSQLTYRLASARSAMQEIEAELELERRNSFTDQERLGKVRLLEARLESAKVAVRESEWYLAHSRIAAPADGVLALADGRAEQLAGKAVRTGDRLFDIYGGGGMVAEIPVNEQNSSILNDRTSVVLFLHTAPEIPIPVNVKEIARYPELTEQRVYCYTVRVELPPDSDRSLRYGMRGIAKLTGSKVSLGYYLFKSVLLYLRGL